ncbi:MAG: MFS transporter [Alphaproteobacteria bacterium]|nr:MFS transporter [Alphaproteobacteria bacterium]
MQEQTSPLQIADFRFYWLSRALATLATIGMVVIISYQLYDVARGQYGYSISEAAFLLGLLGLAQFVPVVIFTPIAGLVADRFDRRTVSASAMGIDLTIALVLAFVTQAGHISLLLLFTLAAMHGTARVFIGPALSAVTPNIVPVPLIPRAMAMSSMAWQSGAIGGPALAGMLYGMGHASPYWTSSGLLVAGILALLSIRRLPPPRENHGEPPLRQIVEGFRFVRNERFLLGCVTLDLFAVLLGGATALLPVFARDVLHVGAEGLGIMRAAPAVGAVAVSLYLSARPIAHNVGAKMLWGVAAFGATTILFGLSRNFALSLGLLALLGAADMVSVFIRSTLVQLNTPDAMRGRVSAISGLAISASNELGEMQSGLAAGLLGATGAVVFGGAGAIMVVVIWAVLFPELRNAPTFAPQYRQSHRQKEPAP